MVLAVRESCSSPSGQTLQARTFLDVASREIELGPAVHGPDGGRQGRDSDQVEDEGDEEGDELGKDAKEEGAGCKQDTRDEDPKEKVKHLSSLAQRNPR